MSQSIFQASIYLLLTQKGILDLKTYLPLLTINVDYENQMKALNFSKNTLEILEDKVQIILDDIVKIIESEGETDIVEYEGSGDGFDYVIKLTDLERFSLYQSKVKILLLLSTITQLRVDLMVQPA